MSVHTALTYDELVKARPEAVRRLANAVGIAVEGKSHTEVCRDIIRWYKRNPQPRPKRR